jgi:hypothetical protein
MAESIRPAIRRRRPRRQGRYRHLLEAVETALAALDSVDRRAPLPENLVAELDGLCAGARRPLARAGAGLAVSRIGAGPVAPGAALVMLLKLHLALEQALDGANSARPPGREPPSA